MPAPTESEILPTPGSTTRPQAMVATYVGLCFLLSTPFWLFLALRSHGARNPLAVTVALMLCPGLAAILTRLWRQRDLRGFGLSRGGWRWLGAALAVPMVVGLLVFGAAWVSGVAPLDHAKLAKVSSLKFIPFFIVGLAFNLFAALGEELGWRGLLVPELARYMGFGRLALVSGLVWWIWHLPLMLFTAYRGSGALGISLAAFLLVIMASSVVQAWFRLASGSVWVATVLHGSWNYFILAFFPLITAKTPAGGRMLGEFGWGLPLAAVVLAIACWFGRGRLPGMGAGGKRRAGVVQK